MLVEITSNAGDRNGMFRKIQAGRLEARFRFEHSVARLAFLCRNAHPDLVPARVCVDSNAQPFVFRRDWRFRLLLGRASPKTLSRSLGASGRRSRPEISSG